jgi:hypothetical protein
MTNELDSASLFSDTTLVGDAILPEALYYAITEQITRFYDARTIFHPASGLGGALAQIEEYPFCFVFALLLRTLRELGNFPAVEVWCERREETIEIRYHAKNGASAKYLRRLKRMFPLFSPLAKEAGLICHTARHYRSVSLIISTPIYEGVEFTLGAISSEAIGIALADAFALDLTPYL